LSFELRPAAREDLPAIDALQLASAQAAFEHIGPVRDLRPDPDAWARRLEEAETATVATADGQVVGFAFSGGGELRYFYTHPRVWGAGAGRALLADAEGALRAAGHAEAVVWTEERNHHALRVYEAAGWKPDGGVKEREWLGVRIRELRLRKGL
jgi:GNAT superfamily N-acetyltransferase